MNRILRGAVLLAVTAALGGCNTEPDQLKDGTAIKISANPQVAFISRADSQAILLRVVDEQGTSVLQPISITNVGPGINVRPDSAFRPVFRGDTMVFNPTTTELRVWVSTSSLANSSFTVTSGDLTLDVPVVVTPNKDESFPFSTLTPALGQVVTASVTSDLLFTDSTTVIFGADTLTPVSVAADGTTLSFNAGPDLLGPAIFNNVTLSYNKNVVFAVTAADTMNSPSGTQPFTFSDPTPALGQQITITPPAGVIFTAETEVSFDSAGPEPHFTLAGDFSSMTLIAGPGSVGPTTFTGLVRPDNTAFEFTLKSADTLVSAPKGTFPITADKAAPAANEAVTLTSGAPLYRFGADDTGFLINDAPALLVSVSADSGSAVVLPIPASAAGATVLTGPVVSGFVLDTIQTSNPAITVGALTSQAGTNAFATAPTVNAPAVGTTVAFWDKGPFGRAVSGDFGTAERLYKLVVPATQSFRFQLPYVGSEDLGLYMYKSDFTKVSTSTFVADDFGGGGAEETTVELTAGTYYLAVVYFGTASGAATPILYSFSLTGVPTE